LVTSVDNNSGSTITKGSVVYINGRHSSNLPTIALAQANTEANSYSTFALVENDITTSNSGTVIQAGQITNLNLPTSTYSDGQIVYLSPTVSGGITTTKPLAPYHIVKIGTITRAHPNLGTIELKIENGWQLDELSDVQIPLVPNDSTLLQFSIIDSLWHSVSVNNAIGTKYIKPSDTASMLSNYQKSATAVKYSDTTSLIATKTNLLSEINYSDTSTLIATKSNVNLKVNISDTSAFQRKSISAYSFMANKTNAVANVSAQTFKDSTGTYSDAPVWSGGTAPTTLTGEYSFTQIGKLVTVIITLNYTNAGSANTSVVIPLPSSCPTPKTVAGISGNSACFVYGTGNIMTTSFAFSAVAARVGLRNNSTSTGYEIAMAIGSSAVKAASVTIQYYAN